MDIADLIVDGTNNGITGCVPTLFGIFYGNASGDLERVAIRNVKLCASRNGCQSGDADRVSGTLVGDGIDLLGNDSGARENRVINSAEAGILIAGNNDDVEQNHINEADFGVLKVTDATGNVIANNEIFNASVKVQDPPVKGLPASPVH